jgi:serine/threonine protein kinase
MSRALGRYELLRPLARGGMGEVYLARRRAAGVEKWLVVKRMRPERAGDARFMDLFKREAMLSMSLAHQNIVPVFDFGRVDDQVFLAMERVEGKDLGSTIQKAGKPLPPLLAAFIAAECCQALDYAHHRKGPDGVELKIVHRDVTPRNLLLSWSGEVKLTDFGIAALAADDPSMSKMAGTPAYMAPEQARAEQLDARADVYAVGMVLREALTGERPRRGADREATIAAAKTGVIDPWPEGFESPLKAIVDKATSTNREDRYPDARSMADDLDEFMVAERSAAKKGDTPARQLASWLGQVWPGEREESVPADSPPLEAGELMSFMDDGALDVLGSGTQRSMLATAAEQTPPAGVPIISDPSLRKKDATKPPVEEAKPAPAPAPSRWPIVVAVLLVAAGAVAFAVWPRGEKAEPEKLEAPIAQLEPLDAAPQVEPPDVAPQPPDQGSQGSATAEQGSAQVVVTPKNPKTPKTPRVNAGSASGSASTPPQPPVVGVKRKVTIQTTPNYSEFTVDGDSTVYQTLATIELAPGSHTIHFTGNKYKPADKTITIEVGDSDIKRSVNLEPTPDK